MSALSGRGVKNLAKIANIIMVKPWEGWGQALRKKY